MKGLLTFAKKNRMKLLNISFAALWAVFGLAYTAGTRGTDGACALALGGLILCALPSALAQK